MNTGTGVANLRQRPAGDKVHDQVVGAVVHADVEDTTEVGVNEPDRGTGLGEKAFALFRLLHQHRVGYLDGHLQVEHAIMGAINSAHAAQAQPPQQLIAAELLRERPLGGWTSRPAVLCRSSYALAAARRLRISSCSFTIASRGAQTATFS
jgi:hypothetical protein